MKKALNEQSLYKYSLKNYLDIRFLTSIDKNTAYYPVEGSESGSFACQYSKV
jgi:hypothetical protein